MCYYFSNENNKIFPNESEKEIENVLHTFTESMNVNFPYKCNYCDNQYSTEDKFLKHALTTHGGCPATPGKNFIRLMTKSGIHIEEKWNPWE